MLSRIDRGQVSEYIGIDRHAGIISWLRRNFPEHQFIEMDFEKQPLPNLGKFDTILLLAVIEHLSNPVDLLNQVRHMLLPNGQLVITTPTPAAIGLHALLSKFHLTYKSAAEEHKSKFSPELLREILRDSRFDVKSQKPFLFGFNYLYIGQLQDDE
jgi:2-polyprenyl-3-methyl-5-hydroxy-6-metoxy-1,4-benzoquinol methylase